MLPVGVQCHDVGSGRSSAGGPDSKSLWRPSGISDSDDEDASDEPVKQEKTLFTVKLVKYDETKKVAVIKEVKNVVLKTIEEFGRLDILVNNAGIFPKIKQLHEIEESEWQEVLDVNLTGQFRFTKAAIPHLKKTSGTIINISSDAGLKAYQGFNADAYSASKAALIILTKCWALQYAKDRIRVNCICPGVVDTDMTKPFLKTEKDREFMDNEHPIGRIGKPDEVAKAVLYFASEDSSWTTGAILAVDGGESVK